MKKFIAISVLVSIVVLVFYSYNELTKTSVPLPINQEHEGSLRPKEFSVSINGTNLVSNSENKVISENLSPSFEVFGNELEGVSINGFILDHEVFVTESDKAVFKLPFLLEPGINEITLVKGTNESQVIEKFLFHLLLKENFDKSISDSDFLLIPNSTKLNYPVSWYVNNGKLELNNLIGGTHASLAFLYPFKNLNLEFEFSPKGDTLNIVFYFLDSGRTIVIGNGDLKRMTLLRSDAVAVEGSTFNLVENQQYKAKIVRNGNNYQLFIGKIGDDFTKIIDYTDEGINSNKSDSVGFSAWPGSDGVMIDNLLISSND